MLDITFSDALASLIAVQRILGLTIGAMKAYQKNRNTMQDTFGLSDLQAELTQDEGKRNRIYTDTKGKISAGIGRNLTDIGVSDDEVALMFANDIGKVIVDLDAYIPWWRNLDPCRQRAMINLCFNMGWGTFSEFHLFMLAMKNGNWNTAAAQLRASKWWSEVGERGLRVLSMITTGNRVAPGDATAPSDATEKATEPAEGNQA